MNSTYLSEILRTEKTLDENGVEHTLSSNISISEISFLEKVIENNELTNSLEIGCAMGVSSLAVCSSLEKKQLPYHHTIIDPYQGVTWKNIGITNLKKAGIQNFSLIERGSEIALPDLLSKNCQFDFIFIDGWHTMDHTMIDMYYSLRLLKKGGIIVIDDVVTKPVNKAIRYFLNFPNIELIAGSYDKELSFKRKAYYVLSDIFSFLSYLVPWRKHIFNHDIINSDHKLKIDTSMIALKKIDEDSRTWNWYENF